MANNASPHMPRPVKPTSDTSQENVHRIYLTEEWYLNVDDDGYVLGPCAEGALGYVLQLQSADHLGPDKEYLALKLPRLRADTSEENAYIARTLAGEANEAHKANRGDQKKHKEDRYEQFAIEGLIGTALIKKDSFLRGQRSLVNNGIDELSLPQHQCIPVLSFSKDSRLRLCNVRYEFPVGEPPKLITFPSTASVAAALSCLKPQLWQKYFLGKYATGLENTVYFNDAVESVAPTSSPAAAPVALAANDSIRHGAHGQLDNALNVQRPINTWYAGVPSIVFKWSLGTLQFALSTNAHQAWHLEDHYKLVRQVVRGLRTLHRANIIHADVRPANIMALGSLSNPEHFHLSDYGSFANDRADSGTGGGHTTPPSIVRHRTSVFYSRERRAGIERENADVAVIIGNTGAARNFSPGYYVRLGWKVALVEPTRGEVRAEVIKDMVQCWLRLDENKRDSESYRAVDDQPHSTTSTPWSLSSGDLFRVRDYVFRISEVPKLANSIPIWAETSSATPPFIRYIDFLCDPNYTCVRLEKLGVRSGRDLFDETRQKEVVRLNGETDSLPAVIVLDLPLWTEIRQSSIAGDIYSAGVIAIYSVYTNAMHRKRQDSDAQKTELGNNQDASLDIETRVETLLKHLEDEAKFNQLWPDLDYLCQEIEMGIERSIPIDILMRKSFPGKNKDEVSQLDFGQVARNLLLTIMERSSELRDIAIYGCYSYGYFLLFIHFVLACIHRRSHLTTKGYHRAEDLNFPFCSDRFERGTKEQVANAVLHRVDKLIGYFQHNSRFEELGNFLRDIRTPQSYYQLLWKNAQLHLMIDRQQSELDETKEFAQNQLHGRKKQHELEQGRQESKNLRRQQARERLKEITSMLEKLELASQKGIVFGSRVDSSLLERIREEITSLVLSLTED